MNQNTKPIIFKRRDVVNLWERSLPFFKEFGASHTTEDLFDPRFWEDGIPRNREGLTEAECQKCREPFWPDPQQMIGKAEPRLLLIGDSGVYLIPSFPFQEGTSPNSTGLLLYAEHLDPSRNSDWYDRKGASFGCSDDVVDVPLDWMNIILESTMEFVGFRLQPTDDLGFTVGIKLSDNRKTL